MIHEQQVTTVRTSLRDWLTVREAAAKLNLAEDTVRRYSSRGVLRGQRLGWTLLFHASEITRFSAEPRPRGRKKGFSPKKKAAT